MPNPSGTPASQEAEDQLSLVLQGPAASTDGPGITAALTGYAGSQVLELSNSSAGATTLYLEGSYDGLTWYLAAYYQMDNQPSAIRSVSPIPVTASPFTHLYALIDSYNLIRARMAGSSSAPAPSLTVTIRANPV